MTTPRVQRGPLSRSRLNNPIRIIVFGGTGVGKTSFVNDASQSSLQVGHDLQSCTKEMQAGPTFSLDGRIVQLYDTPGFDDTNLTDTEILQQIVEFLVNMRAQRQPFTGILYLHRITDNRMSGASVRAFNLFEKICGRDTMRNAVIVTNMWSSPHDSGEEDRETQLKTEFFKTAIDNGAKVARRGGVGPESAQAIIRLLLNCSPIELQIQNEVAMQQRALHETEAGALVDQNLRVRLMRQERERIELEEELHAATVECDQGAQKQLERFRRDREEEARQLRQQLELLQSASIRQQAFVSQPQAPQGPTTNQPPLGQANQSGNKTLQGLGRMWRRHQS